ncbi:MULTISPECIES: hypothetical protein [Bacillales]|jgi:hypothetical protein|uniref:DUF1640 domain-containing protein n=1 Tax=Brevibacillus aydinogluensis TaxID=927786 RepID=A0AA48RBA2_9BACL|nr:MULTISPECIES: hypothetical protein [Bacillales]REK63806.1 MAG: hypothetical protein DF221_09830 [Brevibacillus sp.]MBR8660438.1 hypothetical protein [Brevibacillus sp. NL20B1]NNV03317.1 hypothetical protein [Brevibacillus sp. MCWH]UFJ62988.1 hypothetical protein IRT44_02900 [Anoxybacillus sediminis]CAJ1001280.1 DUF1640 domain-containing protein [Brevibacillus aydinogluensis]
MTPGKNETDSAQRIYQRLDKFEERIDQLEGKMSVATTWLERIEHRLERMEEVRAELLQAITKLQTELELKRITDKDFILKLLDHDRIDMEHITKMIEGDKGRKQERFLQIWAVLGPVLASIISALFAKYFL